MWYNRYMETLRFRDLQRWKFSDLEQVLPVAVTHDSQAKLIVLDTATYNRLVSEYKKARSDSQATQIGAKSDNQFTQIGARSDSQAKPLVPYYNPKAKYKAGDKVLVAKGKRLVEVIVPELDGDGQPIWKGE